MPGNQGSSPSQPAPVSFPFVRAVLERSVVDSTNGLARDLVLAGLRDLPLLVWAHRQTLGRGRRGNTWWSDEGSLTFTLILDPMAHGLGVDQELQLSLTTAVCVIKALATVGAAHPDIGIRWPNDIECLGRKLGGILPERVETSTGHYLLIGIGLNALTCFTGAPAEVQQIAISLSTLRQEDFDPCFLRTLLAAILAHFERALYEMTEGHYRPAEEWNRLNLLRDRTVRVALGPRILSGKVQGISAEGALTLHDGCQVHDLFGGQVLREPPANAL